MDKLRECPFCGGKAHTSLDGDGMAYVECKLCWARTSGYPFREMAVKNWNDRANEGKIVVDTVGKETPMKPLPESEYYGIGKCPRCGAVFMDKNTNYCGNCGQRLDWDA